MISFDLPLPEGLYSLSDIMDEVANPLGFSKQWFALELITQKQYQDLLTQFETGLDRNPEHYRWRAFTNFMKSRYRISDELLRKIYFLGESDADITMGSAMMHDILKHPDCPLDLLEIAQKSDRKHLRKASERT